MYGVIREKYQLK